MDLKNKKVLSTLIVYGIVALVLLLLFLVIPFKKPAASWISLNFALISLALSFYVTIYAFGKGDKLVSKVYGFPIARVGFLYAIIQTVVFIILCIVGAFVPVPAWIAAALAILLLGAAAIGVIITDNIRDHVEAIDEQVKAETKAASYFRLNTAGLADQAQDPEVRKALERLEEDIRYSDPVSNDATKEIEQEIQTKIESLKSSLAADKEALLLQITELSNLVKDRNRVCKENKAYK